MIGYDVLDHITNLTRVLRRRPHLAMSRSSFKILRSVIEHAGIRTTELADLLDIRPPSLTEGLNRLETDGYIERRKVAGDMRNIYIYPTEKSRQGFDRIHQDNVEYSKRISAFLSEEERIIFCNLCDKMYDSILCEYGQIECRHHHFRNNRCENWGEIQ